MSLERRKFLYQEAVVYDNTELDYLDTAMMRMNITSFSVFRITGPFEFRPDLISFRFYKSFHFGWLIMDYNDILDPYEELVVGKEIKIPDMTQYFEFFNRSSR